MRARAASSSSARARSPRCRRSKRGSSRSPGAARSRTRRTWSPRGGTRRRPRPRRRRAGARASTRAQPRRARSRSRPPRRRSAGATARRGGPTRRRTAAGSATTKQPTRASARPRACTRGRTGPSGRGAAPAARRSRSRWRNGLRTARPSPVYRARPAWSRGYLGRCLCRREVTLDQRVAQLPLRTGEHGEVAAGLEMRPALPAAAEEQFQLAGCEAREARRRMAGGLTSVAGWQIPRAAPGRVRLAEAPGEHRAGTRPASTTCSAETRAPPT